MYDLFRLLALLALPASPCCNRYQRHDRFRAGAPPRHLGIRFPVMAARSTWKGFLQLSLVSIPVKSCTAGSSVGGEISLNLLHRDCHSRIQYMMTCPVHGEIQQSDIVMGYEHAKGQYVEIDTD